MSKESGFLLLKRKITLSYFILVIIALVAIGILYNGVQNILTIDRDVSAPNQKLFLTNEILTLIYDAEADARSYYLFRNKQDLDNYVLKLSEIKKRIDKTYLLCKNNMQQIRSLLKIRELSMEQQGVIQKLIAIDRKNEQELIYQRAFDEFYIQAYEILPATQVIRQNTIIRHDSVYKTPEKANFFGKMKKLFSGATPNSEKERVNPQEEKITTYDTVFQSRPLPDSLVKMMKTSLDKLKMRDNFLKSKEISNETQLLHSDRILLDKIREIVASLETEEFKLSTQSINQSRLIISKTIVYVVWLAAISVVLILLFVLLIFRDIAKNKRYNLTLQKAKKNSEELVMVKEQFLAMMSHEIRTPLSSIIGFSEQLDKTSLDEKQELYLSRIRKSSDFLLSLVNDILDLSKINAGKVILDSVRFNLAEVIRDVHQNFTLAAKEKQVEFTCECDPELEKDVVGDPLRFRQVLMNLVGNAVKFTDNGFVKMVATAFNQEREKVGIKIDIIDSGVGIPSDKLAFIFEEFAQADGSVTRKFGGTGLGLAIARKIVEFSNGDISVSSVPGEGSVFTVELDFVKAAKHIEEPVIHDTELKNSLMGPKNILIVDDDETMLLLISSMLENHQFVTDTAANGQIALVKLASNTYDLIFTDLNMPEMNGLELMQQIRSLHENVPVVAITANSVIDAKYRNTGFADFLSKPFKEETLIAKISSILIRTNKLEVVHNNPSQSTALEGDSSEVVYSLEDIIGFVGDDPEAIRKIVKSFVTNSLATIKEISELVPSRNFVQISDKAHKLLPLFKQFHLFPIVGNLEKLERYALLNISEQELLDISKIVIDDSVRILETIEYDWLNTKKES